MLSKNGSGYVAVDLPYWMHATLGTHLAALERWIFVKYPEARMGRTQKEAGGHITDWWLDVSFDSQRLTKSGVRFGETNYAAVNSVPHLWANAKKNYVRFSLNLLKDFLAAMTAAAEAAPLPPLPPPARGLPACVPGPPAAPAPPQDPGPQLPAQPRPAQEKSARFGRVMYSWDAGAWGPGYLTLARDDLLEYFAPPVESRGWEYGTVLQEAAAQEGGSASGACQSGWFPPVCVAELEDF